MKFKIFLIAIFLSPTLFASSIIIGIAGASGSDKTTLAKTLQASLEADVVLVCQDNYYKDLSYLSLEERAQTNFDAPSSLNFELLATHLQALKAGQAVALPVYDFVAHSPTKETIQIKPQKIIIIEGSLIFAVPEIRDICDLQLFVDADMDICLCRRLERDQKERGRSFLSIKNQYLQTVRPMDLKYVAPSKVHADLIIPNESYNAFVLDFISEQLKHIINPSLTCQTCLGNSDT